MNLYELSTSYLQIQEMILEGAEGLEDTLESLNDAIEEKAVGYAKVIKNIEGQVLAIKEEEKRLAERRRSLESNIKRLKENLELSMLDTGKKKIKTNLFTFNIQKNPPSVKILDEEAIPSDYLVKQKPKIDKKAIINDLKNGVEVEGVEIKQGESLRIR